MSPKISRIGLFDRARWPDAFVGGALCLDFCNTVESRGAGRFVDRLLSYTALLRWSVAANSAALNTAQKLSALARRQPAAADHVAAEAGRMREELYRLFSTIEARDDLSLIHI